MSHKTFKNFYLGFQQKYNFYPTSLRPDYVKRQKDVNRIKTIKKSDEQP